MPYRQDLTTKEWVEVDAQGNPVGDASAGRIIPSAKLPFEAPQAAANVNKTVTDIADTNADNVREDRKTGEQILTERVTRRTAGLPEGWMWDASGERAIPIPGYKPKAGDAKKESDNRRSALEMLRIIDGEGGLQEQYDANFKGGSGIREYTWGGLNPSAAPYTFADKANAALPYVKKFMRTPGEGASSDRDQAVYQNLLPSPNVRDDQNVQRIDDMRRAALAVLKQEGLDVSTYDGSDPKKRGTAWEEMTTARPMTSAMDQQFIGGGDPLQAAAFGSSKGIADKYPPELVQAHEALIGRLMVQGGGRIDPQAYAAEKAKLAAQFPDYQVGDPQADMAWATRVNDYLAKGGKTVPGDISPAESDLTTQERLRNDLVNNPLGAAGAGFTDMAGAGLVSALAPDEMQALGEDHGTAMTLGGIGGAITGTSLLGKGVGAVTSKVAPRLDALARLKLGKSGAGLAKGVGTDALYSAIYGNNTGQNPAETAIFGAGGSLLGTGVGKGLSSAIGGVAASAPVQALRARGIPLTAGQAMGGFAKSIEDRAASIPLVGDQINARRLEGLQSFNQQAFNDAGAPIAAKVNEIGQEGTQALFDQVGDAYDSATAGARVPLDPQFAQDFQGVVARGQTLPDDLRGRFGLALNNRVNPINDAGEMTGESYQQAVRGLKSYKAENVKPGFEADYRDALTGAQDALTDQMVRGGGDSVVSGLRSADSAYRNAKTLEDAIGRAKGGSGSGETFTFTPSNLQSAVAKTKGKYPGAHPLEQLANDGQAVLPSRVPDSGTASRGAQMLAGGSLTGAGAAAGGYANEDDRLGGAATGGSTGALMSAILLAGGTKTGQKALVKLLLDRPEAATKVGKALNKRKGMFGSATLPFTQPGY